MGFSVVQFWVLSLLVLLVVAQNPPTDPLGNNLETNTCYSTTNLYRSSSLSVRTKPDRRMVVYSFPDATPQVELQCLNLVETSPQLASTNTLCDVSSLLWLCKAPESTDSYTCTSLVSYIANPKGVTKHGDPYKGSYHWRIEWDPVAKSEFCYPREIFFTMIGTNQFSSGGSVATVVVFTVIVVLVIGLVALFGGQQLKRHLSARLRNDQPIVRQDLPPAMPLQDAMHELDEVQKESKMDRSHAYSNGDGTRGLGLEGDEFDDLSTNYGDASFHGRDTFAPHGRVEIPGRSSIYHQSVGAALDPVGHKSRSLNGPEEGMGTTTSALAIEATSVVIPAVDSNTSPNRTIGSTGRAVAIVPVRHEDFSVIPTTVYSDLKDAETRHTGSGFRGRGLSSTPLRPLGASAGNPSALLSSMNTASPRSVLTPPVRNYNPIPMNAMGSPGANNSSLLFAASPSRGGDTSGVGRTVITSSSQGGVGVANSGSVLGNSPLSCSAANNMTPRKSVQFKAR